jgi:hypothetical protein
MVCVTRQLPSSHLTCLATVTDIIVILFRAMVGGNSGPATAVDTSPIVECLCKKLESVFHSPQKKDGKTISKWRLILGAYHHIRELVTLNDRIMQKTNIQLYELNQTTLLKWYDLILIHTSLIGNITINIKQAS